MILLSSFIQVPAAVSHAEFWSRYYYKVHKLDQDEARRTALKERADMTSSQTFEEELGWGDEGKCAKKINIGKGLKVKTRRFNIGRGMKVNILSKKISYWKGG